MTLSPAQQRILSRADKHGMIYEGDSAICPAIHFCPDWDELPICADSPEADACNCKRMADYLMEREA